jgi:hypothetical protein
MARSPNYPAHGLSEAVGFARQVYDKEKRTVVSGEDIAKALGYSSLSGNARSKIATMKKYGMLEGDESQGMRLSELAIRLLFPTSDLMQVESRKEAALTPNLFQYLYSEKIEGSDESMRNHLVNKLDFTLDGAAQAVASFRDAISFAGLDGNSYNASDTSEKKEAKVESVETKRTGIDFAEVIRGFGQPGRAANSAAHVWTWTLSIPRSVSAELHITGPIEQRDIGRLIKHLNALKEAFDDDTDSSEGEGAAQ